MHGLSLHRLRNSTGFLLLSLIFVPARAESKETEGENGVLSELAAPPSDALSRWSWVRSFPSLEGWTLLLGTSKSESSKTESMRHPRELLAQGKIGRAWMRAASDYLRANPPREAGDSLATVMLLALHPKTIQDERSLSIRNRDTLVFAMARSHYPLLENTLLRWAHSESFELSHVAKEALALHPARMRFERKKPASSLPREWRPEELGSISRDAELELLSLAIRGKFHLDEQARVALLERPTPFSLRLYSTSCTPPHSEREILLLKEHLTSKSDAVRSAAAMALMSCRSEKDSSLLEHADPAIRRGAASLRPLTPQSSSTLSLADLSTAPNRGPIELRQLGKLLGIRASSDPVSMAPIESLLTRLRGDERRAFIRGLADSGETRLFPVLLDGYEDEEEPLQRATFVDALRRLRSAEHPVLQDIAEMDPDLACRSLARTSLSLLAEGLPSGSDVAFEYWDEPGTQVRTTLDGVPVRVESAPDGFAVFSGVILSSSQLRHGSLTE